MFYNNMISNNPDSNPIKQGVMASGDVIQVRKLRPKVTRLLHGRGMVLTGPCPLGKSLVVQRLGLSIFAVEEAGSIPGWETNIPQATRYSQSETKIKVNK